MIRTLKLCNAPSLHNLHLSTYPILPTQPDLPTHYSSILPSSFYLFLPLPHALLTLQPPTTQTHQRLPMPLSPPSSFPPTLLLQSVKQNSAAHHQHTRIDVSMPLKTVNTSGIILSRSRIFYPSPLHLPLLFSCSSPILLPISITQETGVKSRQKRQVYTASTEL